MIPIRLLHNPVRYLSVVSLAALLSGCGVFFGDEGIFRNRQFDYLKADDIQPLTLPEHLSDERLGELYPIPPIARTGFEDEAESSFEIPRPQPLASNIQSETVRIQRLGERSWIMLNVPPGDVWPRIRSFLNSANLTVDTVNIDRGLIETAWLRFADSPDMWDRFRIQIDQGVQPNTSEVHILHYGVSAGTSPDLDWDWPDYSVDRERELWVLELLAESLAEQVTRGGTSLVAQAIGGDARSNVEVYRNEAALRLRLERSRAMATLSHALRQEGFHTFEADAALGLFYVHYERPADKEPGWFRRTFTRQKSGEPTTPYRLAQLVDNLPEGELLEQPPLSDRDAERNLPKAPGYLILVTEHEGDILARIRDPYGKRLRSVDARRLLSVVRRNLI